MRVQILVNHYKENIDTVKTFLSSLAEQTGVLFEVLIASDGGGIRLTEQELSGYPFKIKYAYLPHVGVCHTRNVLLDKANAEYVMFCDIDDKFTKSNGLQSLLNAADENKADIVCSNYHAEIKTEKGFKYTLVEKDQLRIHGKLYRLQYLAENHIRFPDEMETSGDMYFTWLTFALTRNVVWLEDSFYLWCWNPESVTRKLDFHGIRVYKRTLRCYTLLAEELKRRKRFDLLRQAVASVFSMMYIDMSLPSWNKAPKELTDKAKESMRKFIRSYIPIFLSIERTMFLSIHNFMQDFYHLQHTAVPANGIYHWIDVLMEKEHEGVLIIGHGVVGQNLERELAALKPDIYDKYKQEDTRVAGCQYALAFVCVDTPYSKENACDITEVRNAILENNADIYVIKSAILPGSVDKLIAETGKKIICSPEYYGATQHCNNYYFDFTILGGDRESCKKAVQILQKVYDGRHQFRITDAKTAELVKYMENCYLATKVSFCQQFFDISESFGIDYEELRELFVLDPRVEASHTFIYRDHPYWNTHCLNKDTAAIADAYNADLMKYVIAFNEKHKSK